MMGTTTQHGEGVWIFGYGSLMWRASIPFLAARSAVIHGWTRRFWQGSEDHRGVPGQPGRVVTLVEAPDQQCEGRAYLVAASDLPAVLDILDFREKGGYQRLDVDIHIAGGCQRHGLTYLATADNPCYLGPAHASQMASQIAASHGPSGSNLEYLMRLHELQPNDPHINAIVTALREL